MNIAVIFGIPAPDFENIFFQGSRSEFVYDLTVKASFKTSAVTFDLA